MTDLSRVFEDLDRAIAEITPAEAPALAVALAARLAGLAARGMNGAPSTTAGLPQDELLTVEEGAARLKVAPVWIYRRRKGLPFTVRIGTRGVRVSRRKLETWIRERGT